LGDSSASKRRLRDCISALPECISALAEGW
jgi:hypothetical protein